MLTIEAKRHLLRLMGYRFDLRWVRPKTLSPFPIESFSPDDPNSPYAMKYLRDVFNALTVKQQEKAVDIFIKDDVCDCDCASSGILSLLNYPGEFIESALSVTGYTGKVFTEGNDEN